MIHVATNPSGDVIAVADCAEDIGFLDPVGSWEDYEEALTICRKVSEFTGQVHLTNVRGHSYVLRRLKR